ncbi:hypothetical protein BC828DRAFT_408792 [Blastocladiella britannica]|nr:hypothetical protein BC828DRAFT_408792 [Blastocladiella britannica]
MDILLPDELLVRVSMYLDLSAILTPHAASPCLLNLTPLMLEHDPTTNAVMAIVTSGKAESADAIFSAPSNRDDACYIVQRMVHQLVCRPHLNRRAALKLLTLSTIIHDLVHHPVYGLDSKVFALLLRFVLRVSPPMALHLLGLIGLAGPGWVMGVIADNGSSQGYALEMYSAMLNFGDLEDSRLPIRRFALAVKSLWSRSSSSKSPAQDPAQRSTPKAYPAVRRVIDQCAPHWFDRKSSRLLLTTPVTEAFWMKVEDMHTWFDAYKEPMRDERDFKGQLEGADVMAAVADDLARIQRFAYNASKLEIATILHRDGDYYGADNIVSVLAEEVGGSWLPLTVFGPKRRASLAALTAQYAEVGTDGLLKLHVERWDNGMPCSPFAPMMLDWMLVFEMLVRGELSKPEGERQMGWHRDMLADFRRANMPLGSPPAGPAWD